jgi:flavin-dependent dehydrogenase
MPAGAPSMTLDDGSRIAVIGSGPAGSLFAYFTLELAERVGISLGVDVYDSRDFSVPGPVGCNMCGGIVSETLVQNLAADGIHLPASVVQRGIDSYVMHTDVGSVRIETPTDEMRIAAVHRGAGPKDVSEIHWESFDRHLQGLAEGRGARLIRARVEDVALDDGDRRPVLSTRDGERERYDLVCVAAGVNTPLLKQFETLGIGFERPVVTKTLIREYKVGHDVINRSLGTSMHVFLLSIPRLEFAALIPKGDYVTMCLLGEDIDNALGDAFATSPEVRATMPENWDADARSCQCLPHINTHGVRRPFADRVVFIGDSGVTRLYKDGIGAAYRTAKAAARTAVFDGVSAQAFEKGYLPICRSILADNRMGELAFLLTRLARAVVPVRRVLLRVTAREQAQKGPQPLSRILWDIFTGSAPYGDIFRRMFDLRLVGAMLGAAPGALLGRGPTVPATAGEPVAGEAARR